MLQDMTKKIYVAETILYIIVVVFIVFGLGYLIFDSISRYAGFPFLNNIYSIFL
jgi:hypothetical protein